MKKAIAFLISAVLIFGSAVSAFASSVEDPVPRVADIDYILKDVACNVGSWQVDTITESSVQLAAEEMYKDLDQITESQPQLETELENERSSGSNHRITWQALLNAYPYLPVQTVNLPYRAKGIPWIAFYATAIKQYPGVDVLAFDQSGRAIGYEESVYVTIETGQHLACQVDGLCVELGTVGSFQPPTDIELNPPTCDVDWNELCNEYPNHKVQLVNFDEGSLHQFVGVPWIALNYVFMNDGVIILPFDSAGKFINSNAQKTVGVAKGQHMALMDMNSGKLMGLGTVGPVPSPTNEITLADLVTLARALSGQITLTEAQREKYGVTGVTPTISDLVRLAKQLNR